MGETIRLERSGIEECIRKINGAIDQLSSAASEINSSMEELPNYWEGKAYDNAKTTYEEEYKTLLVKTVPDTMGNFRDYIDQCMKTIIDIDNQLAGQ